MSEESSKETPMSMEELSALQERLVAKRDSNPDIDITQDPEFKVYLEAMVKAGTQPIEIGTDIGPRLEKIKLTISPLRRFGAKNTMK